MTQPGNDPPAGAADPVPRQELRRLEARLEARLQEVNARIVLHDGRFAAMGDRINQTDRRNDALSARIDSRLRALDRRLDAIEARFDAIEAHLGAVDARVSTIRGRINARWWSWRRVV